ncbi:MAG: lytic transglycosylase domain-containing protein [Devosiaceae bacterium]|nr:lytic transglycosylase domain-containing protein [Devosiaceae bacterium]
MFFGPNSQIHSYWRASLSVLFGILFFALPTAALANQNIDTTVTGSIGGSVSGSTGSPQFSNALALIADGKYAQAYASARGFNDPVERRTVQWAAIYYGGGAIDANSIVRFAADAPQFASANAYKIRLEKSLLENGAGYRQVIDLLGGAMPKQVDAQIALALAYVQDGQHDRGVRIARQIWINNFLTREQESAIKQSFGAAFTRDDHWARTINLLMNDRARGAERIMSNLSSAQKSLVLARIAVARKAANAQQLLDNVDPAYRTHPLFHFSRGQLARRSGNLSAAVELFNKVTGPLPNSALWWYERRSLARKLIAAKQYRAAYNASAAYNEGPDGRVVDANFHAGWVALSFLNDPRTAIRHFERMRSLSTLSTTISKSNYWLGRALSKLGDENGARAAFGIAARHHMTYYGQLSRYRLGVTTLDIRPMPEWRGDQINFNNRQLVRAVRLLQANGQTNWAERLIGRLIYQVSTPGEMLLTARLAQEINSHNLAILMASVADRKGIALDLFNYPRDGIPQNARLASVDLAAVYAVARQESLFDVDAISRVGARGVMQLVPATAKETADFIGVSYSPSRLLTDAGYNALLGSTYLSRQLTRFDGSLIMAAAAYNGGGGNVNKWIRTFGNPTSSSVDPVVWIEQIPFEETRKYVQRVLANYMLYRERLGHADITIAQALRRIGTP